MKPALNMAVGGALLAALVISLLVQLGWLSRELSGWLLGGAIFLCGLGGLSHDLWKYYRSFRLVSVAAAGEKKATFLQLVKGKKQAQN